MPATITARIDIYLAARWREQTAAVAADRNPPNTGKVTPCYGAGADE